MGAVIAALGDCPENFSKPILQAIVLTESSFNPFAIGIVDGYLERQPRNKEEAVATVLALEQRGFNYSMGLSQVNKTNLAQYGLNHDTVFDPCKNLKAGMAIYENCLGRAENKFGSGETAIKAALSCYYSGNFHRGQQKEGKKAISYVDMVLGNRISDEGKENLAIPVVSTAPRKVKPPANIKQQEATLQGKEKDEQIDEKRPASWDVFRDF